MHVNSVPLQLYTQTVTPINDLLDTQSVTWNTGREIFRTSLHLLARAIITTSLLKKRNIFGCFARECVRVTLSASRAVGLKTDASEHAAPDWSDRKPTFKLVQKSELNIL